MVEEVAVDGKGRHSDDKSEEGGGGDALDSPADAVLGSTLAVAELLEEEEEEERNEGRLERSMQDGSTSNEVLNHSPDEDRDEDEAWASGRLGRVRNGSGDEGGSETVRRLV